MYNSCPLNFETCHFCTIKKYAGFCHFENFSLKILMARITGDIDANNDCITAI